MTRAELIAALEQADGPSRELDAEIAVVAGGYASRWGNQDGKEWVSKGPHGAIVEPPNYTGSLDAALTIVPKGMWAEGTLASPAWIEIHSPTVYPEISKALAPTPALALAIAALKAQEEA